MGTSGSGTTAGFPKRVMVGTFLHNYRWGYQIRGDERGYIEKVKRYRDLGIEFFTIERDPSLQDGMGERDYRSLKVGRCMIPPRGIWDLVILSLYTFRRGMRRYPSRPIAVYAYNQDVENLWTAYVVKLITGAPLAVIYHHIRPAAFVPFREGVRDRTRRGFHPVRVVLNSLLPGINRFAVNHADVHIALSEATREDVERLLEVKECKVIGNGLDAKKFSPVTLPKTFDAAFLGRLAPQKGIDILLKAWSEVVRTRPDSKLVLLGGGEPEDVSLYKRMAEDLRLDGSVTFAGFVDDDDAVRLLNSSRLFVFPSRKEGFAQAVSQAMGCGLCCILSDIPPLKEIYGGAAVFFAAERPDDLAEKIRDMLDSEDERRQYGQRARRLAETFSWETTVKKELSEIFQRSETARQHQVRFEEEP
jgi:glycosyltransferase involved in cell wall biosynthesis